MMRHAFGELLGSSNDPSRSVARRADGRVVSHAEFLGLADAWQSAFEGQPKRQWAIYVEDPLEFAAALLAAWHAGKVVALPGDDRPDTLKSIEAQGFSAAGDLPGALRPRPADQSASRISRPAINPAICLLTVFTSGSQGQPEAITKKLSQLLSEVQALESAFGTMLELPDAVGQVPTVFATVSHQHIYGLLFLVLWPLSAGRLIGLRRLLHPQELASPAGAPEGKAILVTTPAHLKRLGDLHAAPETRERLLAVFSSGGPLPFEASQSSSTALGRTPIEVFGSSETGGIAWRRCATCDDLWKLLPGVQIKVDGEHLSVHSSHLPDANWFTTADRVEQFADGNGFRLLGRSDRIVKIEEKRVSLSGIESLLLATPWVKEARCVSVATAIGTRVGAVLVLTAEGRSLEHIGRRTLTEALRQQLSPALEAIALPRRWRFVDSMPSDAQGKVTAPLLLQLFETQPDMSGSTTAQAVPLPETPGVHWQERSETRALATLDIHEALSIFDGHFDIAPVLAGVAQLDWTLMLARDCFDIPPNFLRLEALKFLQPVMPGTALNVELQFKPQLPDPALCSLSFRLYSQDEANPAPKEHASGRAVWSRQAGASGSHGVQHA